MRLYTPAKVPTPTTLSTSSTSPGEEGGQGVLDASLHNENNYDSRSADLSPRTIEKESRFDDKLHLNTPRSDDKTQLHLTRLDDALHFNGPLREERLLEGGASTDSTPSKPFFGTELNGLPTTQNGQRTLDFSPSLLENGADTITSLESVPWNIEGTDTIKENGCKSLLRKWSLTSEENGQDTAELSEEAELKQLREENKKLKAALKEAAEVNGQWCNYHDQRQKYVQRLLTTIQELHHPHQPAHSTIQVEGETGPEGEARRLRDALTKLQADHEEHVTLLEMQVRAHRDDWEAERSEKQATQTALAEAQARTALLLHELQLLQAKLSDSESKRALCWRCVLPRGGEADGGGGGGGGGGRAATTTTAPPPPPPPPPPSTTTTTTSHNAPPAPVPVPPAPAPGPAPPPTTHHLPQAPLKGWIPVSMLHHIAFSGATPEHQTPVVQGQQRSQQRSQQPSRAPLHHHHQQQQTGNTVLRPRPTTLSTSNTVRRGEVEQTQVAETCTSRVTSSGGESKVLSPRITCAPDTKNLAIGTTDDKKKYEAMGARPKVLGNLQTVVGKGLGLLEDEKTAKHRARSILASAIPVSPGSSGPSTPLGTCIKTPSMPSMPKGYMPITSTVLTPINFRPPFVAHKRPSTMKQVAQAAQVSSASSSSSTSPKGHNESSPASLGGDTTTTSSVCHSTPSTTKNTTVSNTTSMVPATVNSETDNTVIASHVNDRIQSPDSANQENIVTKESGLKNDTKISAAAAGCRRGDDSTSNNIKSQSSDGALLVTRISCSSPTTTFSCTSPSSNTSLSCSNVTNVTTTVCCSSPTTHTTTTSSLPSISAAGVNTEPVSGAPGHTSVNGVQPSSAMTAFRSSSQSTAVTSKSSTNTVSSLTAASDTVSQSYIATAHDTTRNINNTNISIISTNSSNTAPPSQTTTNDTTASKSSSTTNNSTAFASITVTTTATGTNVPPSSSTYSSATSSRSSSPGISLTTFGLNSEGRGIPGAIFFALGSDQRGVRSPQPCTSPRRTSNSSVGVKSPTPDTVTTAQTQRDTLPPSGVKSPTIVLNSSPGPATVKEEHWWSVENSGRQGSQGKVVNSTWVRLMGGQAHSRQDSGLPWRTARAVSGQQLKQARRISQDDYANGPISPNSVSSSTATFTYTPAINSPPSSTLSSATNSAASSPPPSLNPRSSDDLKSMASKNIASAIISYELGSKCESPGSGPGTTVGSGSSADGVSTLTRRQLVCPSCQMLFPPDKHINFLDHFETCRGPEYADL